MSNGTRHRGGPVVSRGVLGFEMLGAIAANRFDYDSVSYTLLYSIEEMLEMFGIVLLQN